MKLRRGITVFILAMSMVLPSYATIYLNILPGNWNDPSIWVPSAPGSTINAGDTVFIGATVILNTNITIKGTLFLNDATDSLISSSKDIQIDLSGKLLNVGVIEMLSNDIHVDGYLENSGEITVATVHSDGDICNSGVLTISGQYDHHGGILRCGGVVNVCDLNMHANGGTDARVESTNLCCSGGPPTFSDQTTIIDSATVTYCGSPLPVEFASIGIHEIDQKYHLEWQVSDENNVEEYRVNRGTSYSRMVQIHSESALENMTGENVYYFTDNSPFPGTSYYQIVSKDYDGSTKKSQVLEITSRFIEEKEIHVYPNPGSGSDLHVWLGTTPLHEGKIEIFNLMGSKVAETSFYDSDHESIYYNFPHGLFLVKVITHDFITTKKYIVR